MSTAEIAKRNFELAGKFNAFLVSNPEVWDSIPSDAYVIFISGSRFLDQYNIKLGKKLLKKEKRDVYKATLKRNHWNVEPLALR